ncbi:hypothetical protein G7Y79_00018g045570 [Physcia stellaris]|nr:hypothetical protein G7Y79_00018g045570 [Physcia stellaris]
MLRVAEYSFAESREEHRSRYAPPWILQQSISKCGIGMWMGQFDRWKEKKNEDFFEKARHRTIFHELISSEILPPQEKQTIRVIQEAANPDKLRKLREELRTVMPHSNSDAPSLKQLEKLSYLTWMCQGRLKGKSLATNVFCVIKTSTTETGKYRPGMTTIFQHIDLDIFPDPHSFLLERLVGLNGKERQKFEHNLVPYSRGSCQCSGLNLTNAEFFMAIPTVLARFDLQLFESDAWDTEMAGDAEHHSPRAGSTGVQVCARPSTH